MKRKHFAVTTLLKKKGVTASLFFFGFVMAVTVGFLATQEKAPHTSELAFTEYSTLGEGGGSVVPASCNSSPPTSHFMNDCTVVCPSTGTTYDPYLNPGACPAANPTAAISAPSHASYNKSVFITWTSQNATACTASGDWSGTRNASGTEPSPAITTNKAYSIYCYKPSKGSTVVTANVTVCPQATPTWNGTSCVLYATGSLTVSSPTCTIPTSGNSCVVNATWSTTNPQGTSIITRDNPSVSTVYNTNNGGPSPLTIMGPPSSATTVFTLSNSGHILDQKTVSASCYAGGWDSIDGECSDPRVVSHTVTGQYYSTPGSVTFTCSGSNKYELRKDLTGARTIVASGVYSGPITVSSLSNTDTYAIICIHGDYAGPQVVFDYNSPPPPPATPILTINGGATVAKNTSVTINWNISHPTNSCTLTAKAVCSNSSCSANQTSAATTLNTLINTGNTDANDPNSVRSILTALRTIAPGHINTDWKALGRKTFKVTYSTDFTLDCGVGGTINKRVWVTTSEEQ